MAPNVGLSRSKSTGYYRSRLSGILQPWKSGQSPAAKDSATNLSELGLSPTVTSSSNFGRALTMTLTPLHPRPMNSSPPPYTDIPQTTNELDAKTRIRLVKQARKLSKVFGDAPALQGTTHRKSRSVATPSDHEGSVSLRKHPSHPELVSLKVQNRGAVEAQEPTYPNHRQLPSGLTSDDEAQSATNQADQLLQQPVHDRDDVSIISAISTVPPLSVNQIRREKIAKLSRHLGENVPPELVFPPTITEGRRRQSMDPNTFMARPSSSPVKRSRSVMSKSSLYSDPPHDSVDFHRRYVQNTGVANPKQRVLSVRRARKLAQVLAVLLICS